MPPPRTSSRLRNLVRTTDHRTIGRMYLATSLAFLLAAGLVTLAVRADLTPVRDFLSPQQYDEVVAVPGRVLPLLVVTPLALGLAHIRLSRRTGAPDVAFPRLGALSYGLFLVGGLTVIAGLLMGGGGDVGWSAYTPLETVTSAPAAGSGGDVWVIGLVVAGSGAVLAVAGVLAAVVGPRLRRSPAGSPPVSD